MSLNKNKGPLLVSLFDGDADLIPREFRAKLGTRKEDQQVPVDIFTDDLENGLVQSQVVQTRTDERLKTNIFMDGELSTTLLSTVFDPRSGLVGTQTRRLVPEGTSIIANELTLSGDQRNLGNGLLDQTVVEAPSLFAGNASSIEFEDIIPAKFRALILTETDETTVPGLISMPPDLGFGEFYRREEQLDVFKFRRAVKKRDTTSLPQQFINYRTNRFKQVETVTETLKVNTDPAMAPDAVTDVTWTELGGGLALEEDVTVPEVFSGVRYTASIPDLIPPEMRAAIPTLTEERTLEGVASPPDLGTGFLSASDEQVTDFTHRLQISYRGGLSLPITTFGSEVTNEFGGGTLIVMKRLDLHGSMTVDTGEGIISSEIRDLGSGLDLKLTKSRAEGYWPVLQSTAFDDEMQTSVIEQTQVVAVGYSPVNGTYYKEAVKAIDKWRSMIVRTTKTPVATNPGNAIIAYEYRPYQFPGYVPSALSAYYRKTSSQLCRHTIRTWWQSSATIPNVAADEIITDSVLLVDLAGTGFQRVDNVLHDELIVGTQTFPPTHPSYSDYVGNITGYTDHNAISVYAQGSGYTEGNVITIPSSGSSAQIKVTGLSGGGGIYSWDILSEGTGTFSNPVAGSGGTGSGAQFWVVPYSLPVRAGGWIGQEKIISAKAIPTDIKNLWKIQTVSVTMR